jgi:hypothetical protein
LVGKTVSRKGGCMKKSIVYFVFGAIAMIMFNLLGCTENERVKMFGGEGTIDLKPGERLVNASWKENGSLWLLTTQYPENAPRTYNYTEHSGFGVVEGTYTIVEH